MANQVDALQIINKELDATNEKLKSTLKVILQISEQSRAVGGNFSNVKVPNDVSTKIKATADSTTQLNAQLKEQDRLERNLISQLAKKELVTESTNRAVIKSRTEIQQQNKLIREASVLSSRYSTELQKSSVQRNRLARTIQDLNLKKSLGNKLTKQEQVLLKSSRTEFNRYDKAIRGAKQSVGRFQESVGNYQNGLKGAIGLTKQLVGAFGLVQGLRLGFDFLKDAARLAREAKGVEFAFVKLGSEGRKAFDDIRKSTRGLLSDLDIKKSLNEFSNFNISLRDSGVLFEFLSVRAAQTGRSVDSLRDSLVEGLSKQSVLRIDNLGISAARLNKELMQTPDFVGAVANIARTEVAAAGDILDKTADSQVKFNVAFENFKVSAGGGFIGDLTTSISDLGTALISTLSDVNEVSDGFSEFFLNLFSSGNPAVLAQIQAQSVLSKELEKRAPIIKEILKLQEQQGVILLQRNINQEQYNKTNSKELTLILERTKAEVNSTEAIKNKGRTVKQLRQDISNLAAEQEGLTESDKERAAQIRKEIVLINKKITSILGETKANKKKKKAEQDAFNLLKFRLTQQIKLEDEVVNNNNKSTKERTTALIKSIEKQKELIIEIESFKLTQVKKGSDAAKLIQETSEANLIALEQTKQKRILKIIQDGFNARISAIDLFDEKSSRSIEERLNSEIKALRIRGFSEKEIAEQILELRSNLQRDLLLDLIESTEKELKVLDTSSQAHLEIERRLYALKKELREKDEESESEAARRIEEQRRELFADTATVLENSFGISGAASDNFFNTLFDNYEKLRRDNKDTFQEIAEIASATFSVIGEVGAAVFDARIEGYEQEIEANTEKYDALLGNEQLSEEQRESLELQREEKEKTLREKQKKEQIKKAKFDKAISIFEITINTASAVAKALPNVPLSILAGVLGLAQLAAVIASPIPAFEKGKGAYDNYEGSAIWGEKRQEVKISKNGNIEVSPKKIANHLTHVKKDDVIHPDANKYFASLSDDDLMGDLHKHSIIASMENQNSIADGYIAASLINNENRQQTDRIVRAIKQNKSKFNVTNKVSLGQDLKYLSRKNSIL